MEAREAKLREVFKQEIDKRNEEIRKRDDVIKTQKHVRRSPEPDVVFVETG